LRPWHVAYFGQKRRKLLFARFPQRQDVLQEAPALVTYKPLGLPYGKLRSEALGDQQISQVFGLHRACAILAFIIKRAKIQRGFMNKRGTSPVRGQGSFLESLPDALF